MKKLLKNAFTLIELLVVIAIIGILSGLIIVSLSGMTQKSTIAKAQVFSNSLRNSLMMNIVGEWKFNGATSERPAVNADVVDSWGGVNNGTIPASPSIPTIKTASNCVSGSCLSFDGVDDYVYFGSNSNLLFGDQTDWTAEYWIYPTKDTWNVLSSSNSNYYLMTHSNGRVYFKSNDGSYYFSALNIVSLNNWQQLVVTCTGSSRTLKVYINGIYQGNITSPSDSRMGFSYLGMEPGGSRFQGIIDEVRVYNAAMPTSQIKEQYYGGLNKLLAKGSLTSNEYVKDIGEVAVP